MYVFMYVGFVLQTPLKMDNNTTRCFRDEVCKYFCVFYLRYLDLIVNRDNIFCLMSSHRIDFLLVVINLYGLKKIEFSIPSFL